MDREYYQYQKIPDKAMFYYFISKNDKGREITKVVAFQQMNILVYNMALVDYDEENDMYLDDNVSNNFDISKIFATIFRIIRDFIDENPLFSVYISGNSDLKQQLYHRILKNNLISLQNDYVILGVVDEMQVKIFDTTNNYIGFIIQKNNN